MHDQVPPRIGRYRVIEQIGSGSMGFVYLAEDTELEREVAIKTVKDFGLDDATKNMFLERFRNEARAAARIRHPNIVQIFDTGEDPEAGPFLVFEYVEGDTLKHVLKSGPLSKERAISFVRQLASALTEAHQHGIIHRDIKPENVLITIDGVAKLADFGIARVPNAALTDEGQFLGTPCYAAPETIRHGTYGVPTDVFSFAAVIYELVTATRAFPGNEAMHVANLVLNETPAPPSKVIPSAALSSSVDAVLLRGLAKDPSKRFNTALALANAFEESMSKTGRSTNLFRGLLAVAALALGGLAIAQIGDCRDDLGADGAGDAGIVSTTDDGGTRQVVPPRGTDAAAPSFDGGPQLDGGVDGGLEDGGALNDGGFAGNLDASSENMSGDDDPKTPHEREEAAKDALAAARASLSKGDVDTARQHLERATRFDPTNPDIEALMKQLDAVNP